jgi:hypothetical protein
MSDCHGHVNRRQEAVQIEPRRYTINSHISSTLFLKALFFVGFVQ